MSQKKYFINVFNNLKSSLIITVKVIQNKDIYKTRYVTD